MMDYTLRQHGRAALDFISAFGPSIGPLIQKQQAALDAANLNEETLADDLDERSNQIVDVLENVSAFRASSLIGEWHAEHHGRIAAEAFTEIKDDLAEDFESLAKGKTTLRYDPDLKVPKYWPYPIHRTTGGWDGHRHMGFIHGCLVQRILDKSTAPPTSGVKVSDSHMVRRAFAEQAPRRDYSHIVDVGCQTGLYTLKLAEVFPQAQISACDISITQLEQAQRNANYHGLGLNLFQADARATRLDDQSCDLFTSYIILHELPVKVIEDIMREAFRTLRSGGDLLFGDVAPYNTLSKTAAWRTDYGAKFGGEPFWRGSANMDMAALLEDIGFVDVKYYGMSPNNFPWVTYGRKP